VAVLSNAERSSTVENREREFTANELVAFSRAFKRPVDFFFMPTGGYRVAVPDEPNGIPFEEAIDFSPVQWRAMTYMMSVIESMFETLKTDVEDTHAATRAVFGQHPPKRLLLRLPVLEAMAENIEATVDIGEEKETTVPQETRRSPVDRKRRKR
jgi:hypothetical protein